MEKLCIGSLELKNRYAMAPLAGYSNSALRAIAAQGGAGITYTEMISANALIYGNQKTYSMLPGGPEKVPVALQLFGGETEVIFRAAEEIEKKAYFDVLDFNLGCPVPKVIRQRAGSAWLLRLDELYQLFRGLVQRTARPVTIKTRLGFSEEDKNVLEVVRLAFQAGVKAVAIHARTRSQFYAGIPTFDLVKEAVGLQLGPIIANGDISADNFLNIEAETKANGFMLGRGALGNPLIFRQLAQLEECGSCQPIGLEEQLSLMLKHYEHLIAVKGEAAATRDFRALSVFYLKGRPLAHAVKNRLIRIESPADLYSIIGDYRSELSRAGLDF